MEKPQQHPASKQPAHSRTLQSLVMVGIGLLACIVVRSALSLGLWLVTSSTPLTGSFWSDTFPGIVLGAVVVIGSLGIYWLIRLLIKN